MHRIFICLLVLVLCAVCLGQVTIIQTSDDLSTALSTTDSSVSGYVLASGVHRMNGTATVHIPISITGQDRATVVECVPTTSVAIHLIAHGNFSVASLLFRNCPTIIFTEERVTLTLATSNFTGATTTAIRVGLGNQVTITNCFFTGNHGSLNSGGAIASMGEGNLSISDSFFDSNFGIQGGAIYSESAEIVTIRNTHGTNNSASTGGFASVTSSMSVFDGVTLSGNVANKGGGIYCNSCNLTTLRSQYTNNSGGAIFAETGVSAPNLTVDSSTFIRNNNLQGNTGGAISSSAGPMNITNCTFFSNVANAGGAVWAYSTSFVIDRSNFTNNTAIYSAGGAIYGEIVHAILTNTFFSQNSASNAGGALHFVQSDTICTACTISNNSATENGGGGNFVTSTAQFTASSFFGNSALGGGGGIAVSNGKAEIGSSTFYQNMCGQYGAAFHLDNSSLSTTNTTFDKNHANYGGGAGFALFSTLNLINSTFSTNTALLGGALYIQNISATDVIQTSHFLTNQANTGGAIMVIDHGLLLINSSDFSHNVAEHGGAISSSDSSLYMYSSYFTSNSAQNGGGMYTTGGILNLDNTSFLHNNVSVYGGGLYVDSSDLFILSGTFLANSAQSGGGLYHNGSKNSLLISVSCIKNSATTGGCAFVASGFVSFTKCQILNNNATTGGGIAAEGLGFVSLSIAESTISGNFAKSFGGGLSAFGAKVDIVGGSFLSNNTCPSNGGSICLNSNSFLYFEESTSDSNSASYGGGIFSVNSTAIFQSAIINNNRGIGGGGIYATVSTLVANSSLFIGNSAASIGGGLYLYGTAPQGNSLLLNCTILQNTALVGDAGLYIEKGSNTVIQNATLSTYNSSSTFCCQFGPVSESVTNGTCSYPTCDENCLEAHGCQCPFSLDPNYQNSDLMSYILIFNDTCTCVDDFYGNTCQESICSACPNGTYCVGEPYNVCSTACPQYTALNGSKCIFVSPCSVENGGCDPRVSCSSVRNQGVTCGSCPSGFYLNGTICTTLCGDGFCDAKQGEDCVSCKKDCKQSSCGKCGDGVCDSNESCISCYEDCLSLCQSTVPISINTSTSQPTADITTPRVQFSIGIRKLLEKDAHNGSVSEIDLDSRAHNFSYDKSVFSNSSQNTVWKYSSVLSNRAVINVTFISFEDSITPYTFGNTTTQFPAHTLKFSLRVANWPFITNQNTLLAIMETEATSSLACAARVDAQKDSGGSVAWVKVTLNGFTAYGQFEPYSIIDDTPRKIRFELNDDNTVSAVMPHFWDAAEFDPSYAVLVGDGSSGKVDECGNPIKSSHSVKRSVAIAVPVTIIGVTILVAAAILIIKRRHESKSRQKWDNIHLQQRVSSESNLIHERAKDMEVNTAAGRFVVPM